MKAKELVVMALFVAMGAVLHLVIPGFGEAGMKPDFSLLMLFIGILLFPEKKNVLLIGMATGIVSGLSTTFPGGLFPNIIDKLITAFVFYGIFLLFKKNRHFITLAVFSCIGTLVSGTIFLSSALLILQGLPASFGLLFLTVVLPTTAFNIVLLPIMYRIVSEIVRRSKIITFA